MRLAIRNAVLSTILALGSLLAGVTALTAADPPPEATYTLPNIDLAEFLHQELGLVVNGHGVDLGGIGSDLWLGPAGGDDDDDGPEGGHKGGKDGGNSKTFYMITDRGPNGEDPRTFPVEEFTPFILKAKVKKDGTIKIQKAMRSRSPGPETRSTESREYRTWTTWQSLPP